MKDPDNIENLVCVSVLEKKVEEFNGKMQAALQAGKRDQMKAWQAKWIAANTKKTVSGRATFWLTRACGQTIENACGSGQMSIEDYVAACKKQLVKDAAMLGYFKQAGSQTGVAIVQDRMTMTKAELQEMESNM